MTSTLRAVVILAAALSLIVAAGCGGDTKENNNYVESVNKVQTDFQESIQKMSATPNAGSAAETAKDTFTNLSTAIDKVIADLKGVEPPDDVKDLHNQLVSEMEQFSGDVKKAGDALTSGDPKAILTAQSEFAQSASTLGTKITKTISDINAKLQE